MMYPDGPVSSNDVSMEAMARPCMAVGLRRFDSGPVTGARNLDTIY